MMIHEITALAGKYKQRKRIGRGPGSGSGKQAGRGHKGAGARAGNSRRYQFEGGQMPFFRRMPKFGFSNAQFRTSFWIINLGDIVRHEKFAQGGRVDAAGLVEAGLVRDTSRDVKILGWLGEGLEKLPVKLEVEASRVSASARRIIEDAGGSVNETGTRKDRVRGIDRNSGDATPKNQTKKLRKRKAYRAKAEAAARGEVLKKK